MSNKTNDYKAESRTNTRIKERLECSRDVFNVVARRFASEQLNFGNQEHFGVVGLNNKNEIMFQKILFIGGIDSVVVTPQPIFKDLMILGCARFIVWHNHPSNDCMPSSEDKALTKRLEKGGKILGVPLLDHMIFDSSFTQYLSLRDLGVI